MRSICSVCILIVRSVKDFSPSVPFCGCWPEVTGVAEAGGAGEVSEISSFIAKIFFVENRLFPDARRSDKILPKEIRVSLGLILRNVALPPARIDVPMSVACPR